MRRDACGIDHSNDYDLCEECEESCREAGVALKIAGLRSLMMESEGTAARIRKEQSHLEEQNRLMHIALDDLLDSIKEGSG